MSNSHRKTFLKFSKVGKTFRLKEISIKSLSFDDSSWLLFSTHTLSTRWLGSTHKPHGEYSFWLTQKKDCGWYKKRLQFREKFPSMVFCELVDTFADGSSTRLSGTNFDSFTILFSSVTTWFCLTATKEKSFDLAQNFWLTDCSHSFILHLRKSDTFILDESA